MNQKTCKKLLDNGKPKTRRVERVTLSNDPRSTRGYYRGLKKLYPTITRSAV